MEWLGLTQAPGIAHVQSGARTMSRRERRQSAAEGPVSRVGARNRGDAEKGGDPVENRIAVTCEVVAP